MQRGSKYFRTNYKVMNRKQRIKKNKEKKYKTKEVREKEMRELNPAIDNFMLQLKLKLED